HQFADQEKLRQFERSKDSARSRDFLKELEEERKHEPTLDLPLALEPEHAAKSKVRSRDQEMER
ncbi:relaxase, partial [Bacillus haynesii]|nr:relaxase [Bacillus haynesii]